MKTIFLTMAAASAVAISAPAAAQSWTNNWNGNDAPSAEFQSRIDRGVRNGAISRREAMPLRHDLRQLASLERQYARNGFTNREQSKLQHRGAMLNRQLVRAERSGGTRYGMDRRFDHDNQGDRGDRYAGDIRIGQHPSARMIAMPDRYRDDYRDNESVYYRYDDNRIYEVDRDTNLVIGLMDLPN